MADVFSDKPFGGDVFLAGHRPVEPRSQEPVEPAAETVPTEQEVVFNQALEAFRIQGHEASPEVLRSATERFKAADIDWTNPVAVDAARHEAAAANSLGIQEFDAFLGIQKEISDKRKE